jgi:hypothetical protein
MWHAYGRRNVRRNLRENRVERGPLKGIGVDVRVILQRILSKYDGNLYTPFIGLRVWTSGELW